MTSRGSRGDDALVDDTQPEAESDLRRRAAWLLVMLAVVAVLFVIVISAVVGSDSGGGGNNAGPGPLDSAARTPAHRSSTPPHRQQHSRSKTPTHTPTTATSGPPVGTTHCPTAATCILTGDIGNGVQAINNYRTLHGQTAVPGQVTQQAQDCAVRNGSGCSGGWAETELAQPDGAQAVQKILQFGKLLDPHLTSIEVGWAYNPGAKLYYFAIVRND